MALISQSLAEKIIGIAKAYASDERVRLSRLEEDGKVKGPAKAQTRARLDSLGDAGAMA